MPFGEAGRLGPLQQVQLRFIFESGKEPELVELAGAETGADPRIPDLVFGWVSWRRPDVGWELRRGMDDDAHVYWLSMRAFAGSQMFLEDGVARDTLARMLAGGEETWLKHTPPAADAEQDIRSRWNELLGSIQASDSQALEPVNLPPEQDTYHPLVRSCAPWHVTPCC